MKDYLFVFTIGPVKSFIANSRKAQDLFAASEILSYLNGIAIQNAIELFKQGNDVIITPKFDTPYKPNRFVAKLNNDKNLNLKAIGDSIEKTTRDAFKNISSIIFKNILTKPVGFDEQLDDFLEIYWLYVPITTSYREAYQTIFKELVAIKGINKFNKFNETGRKCSVDGTYNAKIYRKSNLENITKRTDNLYKKVYQDENDIRIIGYNAFDNLKIWHIAEGEGLSAISLTKRIFNKNDDNSLSEAHQFPSTAKIALLNLINECKSIQEFIDYKEKVVGDTVNESRLFSHSNDQFYYKDNLVQLLEGVETKRAIEVKELHQKLIAKLDSDNITEPFTKYYCLARFDGDNMGDWLQGDWIKDGTELEDFHKEFTECVHQFATKIDSYLTEYKGKTVYAGGEDFMAFVNIHHLFSVLEKIRNTYKEEIYDKLKNHIKESAPPMSISVGVSIAHYKQPISMVYEKAKKMEEAAKGNSKNSVAIGVLKHSNSELDFTIKWNDEKAAALDCIEHIIDQIKIKNFSPAFLRNIYHFFEEYGFINKYGNGNDLIESKIKLYVPRARTISLQKNDKVVVDLIDDLKNLLVLSSNTKEFGNLLLVIDFIVRKTK